MAIPTLDDVDAQGKRVLVRVDLNVPVENGEVTDATRIERAAPTIARTADKGGKVILLAHFGRPKGGAIRRNRLKPVPPKLRAALGGRWRFADDCIGEPAQPAVAAHEADGDVLLLENTRFHAGEEKNDPAFADAARAAGRHLCQ